jgi:hypothetical protein
MPFLKRLFWVYFLLLIFEGALRKWILPQFSAPLLIVRDPVALLIIWEAYRTHKWPKRWSAVTGALVAGLLVLCIVQLVAGQSMWVVALYGLRSYVLPFPVAFIMGENLDAEDLRKFGVWTLWLLLPLVGLEVAQYYASPTAFVNKGAYEGMKQIGFVAGHVRASATFSYVMGMILFLPLAAAYILDGLAGAKGANGPAGAKSANRWLLYSASCALVLAIPVTGSRTVVFELCGLLLVMVAGSFLGLSQFAKVFKIAAALLVAGLLVTLMPVFSQSMESMTLRFSQAEGAEGGAQGTLSRRIIGPIAYTVEENIEKSNWLGLGVGYGAMAMASLLGLAPSFAAGEDDFSRIVSEFGLLCGPLFMLFRLALELILIVTAIKGARNGRPLALFLLPLTITTLVFGSFEQPTVQGFMVISVAFLLASRNRLDARASAPPRLPPARMAGRRDPRFSPIAR